MAPPTLLCYGLNPNRSRWSGSRRSYAPAPGGGMLRFCCGAEKIFGLSLILDFFDRCHSFPSLHLPQAALGSLPRFSLASPVPIGAVIKKSAIPIGMTDFFWSC